MFNSSRIAATIRAITERAESSARFHLLASVRIARREAIERAFSSEARATHARATARFNALFGVQS